MQLSALFPISLAQCYLPLMSFKTKRPYSTRGDATAEYHRVQRQKAINAACGDPDRPIPPMKPLWSPERDLLERHERELAEARAKDRELARAEGRLPPRKYVLSEAGLASLRASAAARKSRRGGVRHDTEEVKASLDRLRGDPRRPLPKKKLAPSPLVPLPNPRSSIPTEHQKALRERFLQDPVGVCAEFGLLK